MEYFNSLFRSFNMNEPGFLFMWGLLFMGVIAIVLILERGVMAILSGLGVK